MYQSPEKGEKSKVSETVYTAKGWVCPRCKKSKTEFSILRLPKKYRTYNMFSFSCKKCNKTWGFVSSRYNDVNNKDLIQTFKTKWEHAVFAANRGDHKLLEEMEIDIDAVIAAKEERDRERYLEKQKELQAEKEAVGAIALEAFAGESTEQAV